MTFRYCIKPESTCYQLPNRNKWLANKMTETQNKPFKSGYVVLIGKPNVGKSTLMNQFLKQKVAIVSKRPQTTRHQILGILSEENYQIIFLDTPGLIQPKYELQKSMMKTAQRSISEADLILMMVEARGLQEKDENVLSLLEKFKQPKCLVINKVDITPKEQVLPLIDRFKDGKLFKEMIPISAKTGDGTEDLRSIILSFLPAGEPFYPPEMISSAPERFFVAELIREKIFENFGEEIPYSTAVMIEEYEERPKAKDYVRARIFVERDSQKGILIGKSGHALKKVGQQAREDIEKFLDRPVYLELEVRVRKKWRRDAHWVKRLGY